MVKYYIIMCLLYNLLKINTNCWNQSFKSVVSFTCQFFWLTAADCGRWESLWQSLLGSHFSPNQEKGFCSFSNNWQVSKVRWGNFSNLIKMDFEMTWEILKFPNFEYGPASLSQAQPFWVWPSLSEYCTVKHTVRLCHTQKISEKLCHTVRGCARFKLAGSYSKGCAMHE